MTRPRSYFGHQRRPVSRRPGVIPGRRFALALAAVSLGASGGVADAAGNASQLVSATIYQAGKPATSDSVSIGALEADPAKCPTYSGPTNDFLGPTGDTTLPPATWTLSSVLGCLTTPVAVTGVTQVIVQRQDGSFENAPNSQLARSDLTPPGNFPTSGQFPVISSDGSNVIYNRPKRGPSDNNQGDYVLASGPSAFVIDVYEGPPLTVKVNASATTVAVGGSATFSATVTGPQATGLTYSWNFGGGAPNSTSPIPHQTFHTQGVYSVTLQVGDTAGGGGTDTVSITVGPQAPAATGQHNQKGTGSDPKSPTPDGPRKSHGHHVGGPVGKPKTNATGDQTTPAPANKPGSSSHGSPSTHRASAPAKRAAAAGHRSSAATKPPAPGSALNSAHAPVVTGLLVSDLRLLSPAASPFVRVVSSSVASAPPARRATRASLAPALAGVLAILLLFILGARRELRGTREQRGWRGLRAARAGN